MHIDYSTNFSYFSEENNIYLNINDRIHILEIKIIKNNSKIEEETISGDIMKKAGEYVNNILKHIKNENDFKQRFILSHKNTRSTKKKQKIS